MMSADELTKLISSVSYDHSEFEKRVELAAQEGVILLDGNVDRIIRSLPGCYIDIDYTKDEPFRRDDEVSFSNSRTLTSEVLEGNYTAFDLETTGLLPLTDEVIELSAVRFRGFKAVESFSTVINPGCSIPDKVVKITGISDDDVWYEPTIEQVIDSFNAFVGTDILVGHNILSFDLKFLYRCGFDAADPKRVYYDTLSMARKYIPKGTVKNNKLDTLLEHFGIVRSSSHRGLTDSVAEGLLFAALVDLQSNS